MLIRNVVAAIVSAAIGVGALFGYVATVTSTAGADTVSCPTEDSCQPTWDTRTNSWVIRQITP